MVTYSDYINYFENLAKKHTDIRHDEAEKKSFFTIDIEELITGIKSKIQPDKYSMMLVNYSSVLDHDRQDVDITFFIIHKEDINSFHNNTLIRNECLLIANDIIGKINIDSKSNTPEMDKLWFGSMDKIKDVHLMFTSPIVVSASKYIGVQCSFKTKAWYCAKVRPNKF